MTDAEVTGLVGSMVAPNRSSRDPLTARPVSRTHDRPVVTFVAPATRTRVSVMVSVPEAMSVPATRVWAVAVVDRGRSMVSTSTSSA